MKMLSINREGDWEKGYLGIGLEMGHFGIWEAHTLKVLRY